MKSLFIAFSKQKSKWAILSRLIRVIEKSDFSHALIMWYAQGLKRDMVYQASRGMAHFMSGVRFSESSEIVVEYEILLNDVQFNNVMRKCVDLAGVKYGTFQLLGMALERITGIKNPFRDGIKTFVCSELVGEVLKQIYGETICIDLELVGPKDLEILVSKLPGVRRTF